MTRLKSNSNAGRTIAGMELVTASGMETSNRGHVSSSSNLSQSGPISLDVPGITSRTPWLYG